MSGFTSNALADEEGLTLTCLGCWFRGSAAGLQVLGTGCIFFQDSGFVYLWEPAQIRPNYHLKWIS